MFLQELFVIFVIFKTALTILRPEVNNCSTGYAVKLSAMYIKGQNSGCEEISAECLAEVFSNESVLGECWPRISACKCKAKN